MARAQSREGSDLYRNDFSGLQVWDSVGEAQKGNPHVPTVLAWNNGDVTGGVSARQRPRLGNARYQRPLSIAQKGLSNRYDNPASLTCLNLSSASSCEISTQETWYVGLPAGQTYWACRLTRIVSLQCLNRFRLVLPSYCIASHARADHFCSPEKLSTPLLASRDNAQTLGRYRYGPTSP